jgi:hypothetical protein
VVLRLHGNLDLRVSRGLRLRLWLRLGLRLNLQLNLSLCLSLSLSLSLSQFLGLRLCLGFGLSFGFGSLPCFHVSLARTTAWPASAARFRGGWLARCFGFGGCAWGCL